MDILEITKKIRILDPESSKNAMLFVLERMKISSEINLASDNVSVNKFVYSSSTQELGEIGFGLQTKLRDGDTVNPEYELIANGYTPNTNSK